MFMNCFHCLYFESHRCRNKKTCPPGMSYVEYTGSTVRQCLEATTEIYRDGYIHCPILESVGCERCMERFGDGSGFEPDEDQNYERKPRWQEENGMRDCGLPKEVESQCCLNRGGMCTLDTADFGDIDRAVGMRGCGFIGVNDRYLLWKYGVPYKDLVCGSCGYFEAGEYSWGVCTNERVKPHPKGVTENGEKRYLESKEYYSGAHACGNFVKRGSREVAKKTYWTKCGREFEKISAATVTGCEIPEGADGSILSERCKVCPFPVEVTDGWGENKKHVRWECRAGSQPPNHKTEWAGNLDDKNTIQINSLDYNLLEEIREYCEAHPDLGAGYNTDHLADCRRTLSVCCSPNKKGITAKHELIEKFFQDDRITQVRNLLSTLIGKEIRTHYNTGGIVTNVIGPHNAYGPGSWTINYTEDGKKRKNPCIINSIKVENGIITCDGKPLQIIEPKKDDETCEESQTNTGSVSCVAGTQEDIAISNVDKPDAMTAQGSNGSDAETCANCQADKVSCQPYQVCISAGLDPEECVCNSWSEKAEGSEMIDNTRKTAENDDFLPENVTKNDEIVTFDYSSVDEETGVFLQEKANNIILTKNAAAYVIGKELKEAQQKLASHDKTKGAFIKWVKSLGFSDDTAYNYINLYTFLSEQFGNINEIANAKSFLELPAKLRYAVSKPSARPELQQAVLSGDITSHKQYKELEEKLRIKEQELASVKEFSEKNSKYADEHMMRARTAEFELEKKKKAIESLQSDLQYTKRQLEEAVNSPKDNVVELMELAREKQCEIEALRKQLKDKPIEATATRVVEKLPDDVQEYLSSVDTTIHHMQNYAKVNQVLNLVVGLSTEEMQSWAMMMNNRKAVDDDEESENLELLDTAIQSLQDMMEDYRNGGCE